MKTTQKQTGSAHIIVVISLVFVIIGLLGFVVWQNFIKQPSDEKIVIASSEQAAVVDESKDTSETLSKTSCFTKEPTLCFKYPEGWTVVADTSASWEKKAVKDKEGDSLVEFNVRVGGIGGIGPGEISLSVNKVALTEATALSEPDEPNQPVVVVGGVAHNFVSESEADDYQVEPYSNWYPMAYLTAGEPNAKAGQVINPGFWTSTNGFMSLDNKGSNGGSVKWNTDYASQAEAQTAYESKDFQTAFNILKSTYYK